MRSDLRPLVWLDDLLPEERLCEDSSRGAMRVEWGGSTWVSGERGCCLGSEEDVGCEVRRGRGWVVVPLCIDSGSR